LNKVKNFWVKGVLEKSLHEQILITLDMEERPDAIERPYELIVGDEHQVQELPSGTTILSVFDGIGAGRTLLILGEPGSGKTNSLLQLARELIARAEQDVDCPIPVVFNLSSWTPTQRQGMKTVPQSIAEWLVEELRTKYEIPKKIAADWVQKQQLLLLLDGLDEVKQEHRSLCVNALNTFQQEASTEMVVCCRVRDYEALKARLRSQMAVYIQPLTLPQIQIYLHQLKADLTGLNTLIATDSSLQKLAQSPLLLNIMVVAYQGVTVDELTRTQATEDRRQQLFDTYINRMLGNHHRLTPLQYPKEKFMGWLIWLSQRMVQESQTVFLIEGMQPSWLRPGIRKLYLILITLIAGLLYGLSSGLIFVVSGGLFYGLFYGLITVLIAVLITVLIAVQSGGLSEEITIAKKLEWFWQGSKSNLLGVLTTVLFIVLIGVLQYVLSGWLISWLISWLIGALSIVLPYVLNPVEIGAETTNPNQGIWNSAKSFFFCQLGVVLFFGLSAGLSSWLFLGLSAGLFFGLIVGLNKGGKACIQHFILRLILTLQGHTPWNYARFLDHAAERLFLQKAGGGYIFIHRLLLEHIAQLDPHTFMTENRSR
jgi:DNA polymerase III delta prime subunit